MNDFDINRTIKNTVATFEGICRKKMITIELHLESETLMVHADMEQIQQVLYNLIDNAIKFSSDSSIIKAETSERHGTVFVSIKDSGVGIPREKQNKIWDRFYKIVLPVAKTAKVPGSDYLLSARSLPHTIRISMLSVLKGSVPNSSLH